MVWYNEKGGPKTGLPFLCFSHNYLLIAPSYSMVRVLGNSVERIPLPDLGDVIYYRQKKQYSDEEYASSRDLKKEIQKGRVILLGEFESARPSVEDSDGGNGRVTINQQNTVDVEAIKRAVKEAMPAQSSSPKSVMGVMRDALPMLITTIRQEMSAMMGSVPQQSQPQNNVSKTQFREGDYVPQISTEGMVSHVKAQEKEVGGDDMASSLAALRKLKKS